MIFNKWNKLNNCIQLYKYPQSIYNNIVRQDGYIVLYCTTTTIYSSQKLQNFLQEKKINSDNSIESFSSRNASLVPKLYDISAIRIVTLISVIHVS